tara:strand:- start:387 stop:569 length:183 start_codon:yes stop_codon:yes gene_type:complete
MGSSKAPKPPKVPKAAPPVQAELNVDKDVQQARKRKSNAGVTQGSLFAGAKDRISTSLFK